MVFFLQADQFLASLSGLGDVVAAVVGDIARLEDGVACIAHGSGTVLLLLLLLLTLFRSILRLSIVCGMGFTKMCAVVAKLFKTGFGTPFQRCLRHPYFQLFDS